MFENSLIIFIGLISEINLPVDKLTRKLKGFGTVTFMMPEHAVKAYSELDGSIFNGRMLHLLPGKANTSLAEILENGIFCFNKIYNKNDFLIIDSFFRRSFKFQREKRFKNEDKCKFIT